MKTRTDAIDSSQNLFHRPLYRTTAKPDWYKNYYEAIENASSLTWDTGSILSTLSYGYSLGNATFFKEIRRRPWLSKIQSNGGAIEMPIPAHGLYGGTAKQIGSRLFELMCDEAEKACHGREKVYVLLSGGLDSRVVGGVIRHLQREKRIDCEVEAVTWGIENCRDVFYGKNVAQRLGFKWHHADLNQDEYFRNIDLCAEKLAASVAPVHLHRMNWFENASPDSLVLAGSLGNMIGRGQITSRSMLEVMPIVPFNYLGIMVEDAAQQGFAACKKELQSLRNRAGEGLNEYVYREHEQACHFSRGMLCQTMSIINEYCDVYQMLSDPSVYSFMWSRHPAVRTDQVYAEALELVGQDVASVPWTRTNKALRNTDSSIQRDLIKAHNEYRKWTFNFLNSEKFDQDKFLNRIEKLSFLNTKKVETLIANFRRDEQYLSVETSRFPWTMSWLVSFCEFLNRFDKPTSVPPSQPTISVNTKAPSTQRIRRYFANNAKVRANVAKLRRYVRTRKFLKQHPILDDPEFKVGSNQ